MKQFFKFFIFLLLGSVGYGADSDNMTSPRYDYDSMLEYSKLMPIKENIKLQQHLDDNYYAAIEKIGLTPKFDIRLQDGKRIWKTPKYLESLKRNSTKFPNNYFIDSEFIKDQKRLLDECSQTFNIPSPGNRKKKALELIARVSYYKEINENNFFVCSDQIEIIDNYIKTTLEYQKSLGGKCYVENNFNDVLSRKNDLEYWFNEFLGHLFMSNHTLALCSDLKDKSEIQEFEFMQQEIEMEKMESADHHSKVIDFDYRKRCARQLKKAEFKSKQKLAKIEEERQQADALKLQKEKEEFKKKENKELLALKVQEGKEKSKSAELHNNKTIAQTKKPSTKKEKKLKLIEIEKEEKEEEELLARAIAESQKAKELLVLTAAENEKKAAQGASGVVLKGSTKKITFKIITDQFKKESKKIDSMNNTIRYQDFLKQGHDNYEFVRIQGLLQMYAEQVCDDAPLTDEKLSRLNDTINLIIYTQQDLQMSTGAHLSWYFSLIPEISNELKLRIALNIHSLKENVISEALDSGTLTGMAAELGVLQQSFHVCSQDEIAEKFESLGDYSLILDQMQQKKLEIEEFKKKLEKNDKLKNLKLKFMDSVKKIHRFGGILDDTGLSSDYVEKKLVGTISPEKMNKVFKFIDAQIEQISHPLDALKKLKNSGDPLFVKSSFKEKSEVNYTLILQAIRYLLSEAKIPQELQEHLAKQVIHSSIDFAQKYAAGLVDTHNLERNLLETYKTLEYSDAVISDVVTIQIRAIKSFGIN